MGYRSPKLNEAELKSVLESKGAGDALTVYNTVVITAETPFAERTVADLVSKLRQWGQLSPKQESFLSNLLEQIKNRPAIEAARKAEHDAAPDLVAGEQVLRGTVLKIKEAQGFYGYDQWKLLLKLDSGNIVYGTLPSRLVNIKRGDVVSFRATVKVSPTDPKFGFYSRPTQATLDQAAATA